MTTLEMARLELSGAAQSLRIAQQDLQSFLQEHAGEKELQRSLAHEEELLRADLDNALRRHQESLRQFEEARDRQSVNIWASAFPNSLRQRYVSRGCPKTSLKRGDANA
jgi:hypothetical protein